MRYEHTTLTGQVVQLDGNEFDHCTFERCTLVYSGGAVPSMTYCRTTPDCKWTLNGAAEQTLGFMTVLYPFAKDMIEGTFDAIRGKRNSTTGKLK